MAFLTIAGINVRAGADSTRQTGGHTVGALVRAFDGTLHSSIRAVKREWTVSSPEMLHADELTLRAATANGATVTMTGDLVGGASVSVKVQFEDSPYTPLGTTTFRRAPVLTIREV